MSTRRSSISDMLFRKKDTGTTTVASPQRDSTSSHRPTASVDRPTFNTLLPDGKPLFQTIEEEPIVESKGEDEFQAMVAGLKVNIDHHSDHHSIDEHKTKKEGRTPSSISASAQAISISSTVVPPKPPTPTALIENSKTDSKTNTITMQLLSKALPKATLEEKEIALKVSKDIELCKIMYSEDRVGEAAGLLSNIIDFVETLKDVPRNYLLALLDEKTHKFIREIREAADHVTNMLQEFNDVDSWTEWNSSIGPHQDVTVFTHKDDKDHDYAIKIQGNVHCQLKEVTVALLETHFYHFWMPMCTNCKVLSTITPTRKIVRVDLDFVLLKKTAIMEVKGDILPDGQILVTFASLPFEENTKYYQNERKVYMILSGGFLIGKNILEVEEQSTFDKVIARSQSQEEDRKSHQILHRSTPAGKTMTTADMYHVQMDDIYANLGDVSNLMNNPLKSSSFESPQVKKNLSSSMSWYESTPKKVKRDVVFIQAIFKADLLTEFVPDWIFNLAIRSAISMLIPMLEHQATLFQPGGYHHDVVKNNSKFYDELHKRINKNS